MHSSPLNAFLKIACGKRLLSQVVFHKQFVDALLLHKFLKFCGDAALVFYGRKGNNIINKNSLGILCWPTALVNTWLLLARNKTDE